ncbi:MULTISPECIES: SURF1 family cytochrome oxidase biogenesis protein [Mycobacterium]|jgi:cytochrome oxidase assembly protein ShyY1|uniref:SURF1-like protein n=1 Tax=Mycobacterium intracellulare 1956 TaxID=1299331 RepID=X8CT18_MYCIT|nr:MULTISPECIES: SURF1 family protein [Mycobacterium]EUA59001.1 SURF1 family protein [Mycobacterium intracellulare 1956]ASW85376.1 SURF1 family protein [Mycobacterium intracellulare]MCA2249673.1 SURF1 family protein [Mycobacterium intracellulare]MCA2255555.1 SURF1 family protein [Mycobacterium intracellulare]MCA2304771.1 SURF1 family protein [Mycobacterium intracellulare]
MRRLAFVLRPGWIVLALVVIAFAYLCFTVLAPWQLGKHNRTSRENHQIEHSLNTAPVPVKTLLPQQNSVAPGDQWRQVTATGHYLPDVQVLARLRVIDSKPAFEVLAPFVVDGGPTVLVDRGYVRPLEGSRVPPIPRPPADTVTVTARLRNSEPPVAGKDPFVGDGVQQVYSIDTGQIAVLTKVPLAGSYLQLVDGQPGGLGVVGVPQLDAGPFLSYGIQWIAFGILAPIGLGYFAYSEIRARRQEKQSPAAALAPAPEAPPTVEDKLADRYGRRR